MNFIYLRKTTYYKIELFVLKICISTLLIEEKVRPFLSRTVDTNNDVVARAIFTSGTTIMILPVGLTRLDGKWPDGLTLISWQDGNSLTWDVTVVSTLADSYLHVTSHSAGGAAEIALVRKESKYSALPSDYLFQPIAFENLGPMNGSGLDFLSEVGCRLSARDYFYTHLFQTRSYF